MRLTIAIPSFSLNTLSTARRTLLLPIIWLLTSVALFYARLTHPAFGVQGDLPLHYHLIHAFARSLSEGDWLPRWAGLLDGGRGDAFFTFYPPLFYWLSAGLAVGLKLDLLTTLKIVSLLCLLIAQASAYLLAREFFTAQCSLLVSVLYVLLPAYPLITINRCFLPNGLALALVPLLILGAHLLLTGKQTARGLALFVLSLSAVTLTHVITTYLCLLAVGLLALCYLPRFGARGLWRLAGAGVIALALTAFFWLPQQMEMSWVQVGLQLVQQDYRNYFLFAAAPDKNSYRQGWADLNYVASLITLAQTATVFIVSLACWQRWRPINGLAAFILALTSFALFIALPFSNFIWRFLPGLKFIQFPWRLQPFIALGCALLTAALLGIWPEIGRRTRTWLAAVLTWLFIANFACTFMVARLDNEPLASAQVAHLFDPQETAPLTLEQVSQLREEKDLKALAAAANQLYFRPHGADRKLYPPTEQYGGLSFVDNNGSKGRLNVQALTNTRREFQLENSEPVRVRLETYYYPHWVARVDGQETKISAEPESGLMLIDLPAGKHTLTVAFEPRTPAERFARWLSLLSWPLFAGWLFWQYVYLAIQRRVAAT